MLGFGIISATPSVHKVRGVTLRHNYKVCLSICRGGESSEGFVNLVLEVSIDTTSMLVSQFSHGGSRASAENLESSKEVLVRARIRHHCARYALVMRWL